VIFHERDRLSRTIPDQNITRSEIAEIETVRYRTIVANASAAENQIINDKLLAYAFILTHEGYPCVFWQDYFNWDLAQPNTQNGIDALIKVHEHNAAGQTQVLHSDDDLYIMQRTGAGDQSGLLFVLNNRGNWNGT
jgi:alpha-amylase